ncbi:MAG: NADH-quinone oxidoreductase subunit NuoG, partial [Gammaproteobacteria bacterium]|nr:NADH-quinone oxidoreductase subunit NuoG [Gammaproteobacteria bacterium]
ATPVAEGMKISTKSPAAIAAQRATMEFLLINHPLDCPICDQGGECELQDLAMGYGRDISRYNEGQRVVADKDIGPLVSTDMTRCIHCTRCVRFTEEVAGFQELGTMGRGEDMKIGTYVEKAVNHELSGNIIDLCPVGALNSKPFRYRARAWEMIQQATVSPHDSFGSNMFAHVKQGRLMRVVPQPNDEINETWLSDRDRFSYDGIYSTDRVIKPLLRIDGEFRETEWSTVLEQVSDRLQQTDAAKIGFLSSPGATVEESFLLQRIARGLGTNNIDHRLQARDLGDSDNDPVQPHIGTDIVSLESADAIAVIGSDLRREVPMLAHRVRKAALAGATVSFINPPGQQYQFSHQYLATELTQLRAALGALIGAAEVATGKIAPDSVAQRVDRQSHDETHRAVAESLAQGERSHILLGHLAQRHPAFTQIRALASVLADMTGATIGFIPESANAAGASLVGVLPHRGAGGEPVATPGLNARQMLADALDAYVLFGFEPEVDTVEGAQAVETLRNANFVVVMSPWLSEQALEYADVILPIGTFAETAGTYVNLEGRWQSFSGVATPVGEARPGWKVLRVLANYLHLDAFDYNDALEVTVAAREAVPVELQDYRIGPMPSMDGADFGDDLMPAPISLYGSDSLVRRSRPLQRTPLARGVGES